MDLLGGYGSGSDSDSEAKPVAPAPQPAAAPSPAVAAAPKPALFNPFAEEAPGAPAVDSDKRPFTAVVGHSLPAATSRGKAAKGHAAAGPAASARKGGASALLPPQLRGRSNVVTEDVEKLGMAKKRPGGGGGGSSSGSPAVARPTAPRAE